MGNPATYKTERGNCRTYAPKHATQNYYHCPHDKGKDGEGSFEGYLASAVCRECGACAYSIYEAFAKGVASVTAEDGITQDDVDEAFGKGVASVTESPTEAQTEPPAATCTAAKAEYVVSCAKEECYTSCAAKPVCGEKWAKAECAGRMEAERALWVYMSCACDCSEEYAAAVCGPHPGEAAVFVASCCAKAGKEVHRLSVVSTYGEGTFIFTFLTGQCGKTVF